MENNDLTIWFDFDELNDNQKTELRKLGFVDGIYTCPCGTCDPWGVLFREFPSEDDADSCYSTLENNKILSYLLA